MNESVETAEEFAGVPQWLGPKVPGYNVDAVDVAAGLAMLERLGWSPAEDARTFMVIEYALQRWARGEEADAERGAIDASFYGIDFTSWRVVLSAALSGGAS